VSGEWGIFLGYGSGTIKYLRAYIPNSIAVYSRYKCVPLSHVPPEWNLPNRIRQPDNWQILPFQSLFPTTDKIPPTVHTPYMPYNNNNVQSNQPIQVPAVPSSSEPLVAD